MQAAVKIGIVGINYLSKAAASTEEPPKGRMTAIKSKAAKPKKTSQASSSQQPPPELELNLPPPKGQVAKKGSSTTSQRPVCPHPDFIRYGNGWGSFARCKVCYQRWRWNAADGVWKSDGCSSSPSPLPQSPWMGVGTPTMVYEEPSDLTANLGTGYQVAQEPPCVIYGQIGTGAQEPLPPTRRKPKRTSRAASMTSSAAGHGLTAEALQDFDSLMSGNQSHGRGASILEWGSGSS